MANFSKRGVRLIKIGLTLPINYLAGQATSESDLLWTEMFSTLEDCLSFLKQCGVRSIEINRLKPSTDPKLMRRAVENILSSDLKLTVHVWLPMEGRSEELLRLLEAAEEVLRASDVTDTIACTVHGHHVLEPPNKEEAAQLTIKDLASLTQTLATMESLFVPALEVCRHKSGGPVGVTYTEVLEMANQVPHTPLGVCWDLGHSQVNYVEFGHVAFPEQPFLKRLIHTHIHDILPNGKTHGPLLNTDGYVQKSLRMIKDSGYQGVYNLELYPDRWEGGPSERKEALEISIKNLGLMLTN